MFILSVLLLGQLELLYSQVSSSLSTVINDIKFDNSSGQDSVGDLSNPGLDQRQIKVAPPTLMKWKLMLIDNRYTTELCIRLYHEVITTSYIYRKHYN